MTIKTTTALIAAMTMAFSAQAFAGETPPIDDQVKAEFSAEMDTKAESDISVETEKTKSDMLTTATPIEIESEVASEVVTSDDVYAPLLGEADFEPDADEIEVETESADIDVDAETETDIDADLKSEPEDK